MIPSIVVITFIATCATVNYYCCFCFATIIATCATTTSFFFCSTIIMIVTVAVTGTVIADGVIVKAATVPLLVLLLLMVSPLPMWANLQQHFCHGVWLLANATSFCAACLEFCFS